MAFSSEEQRIGTNIDTYHVTALLGRGGMGAVYKGVHTWTGREVAIKFLHTHLAGSEQSIRRFMKEAQAAVALHHPNVVDVLDMGREEGGDVYLVMELLHGQSLRTLIAQRGRIPLREALQYLLPIMDALECSHRVGVVHRDLKPDNIFLARSAAGHITPKLLDYGVAKFAAGSATSGTTTGAILGTPRYMSPEQANGESVGPAADIWAIGMVLHELLAGTLPFADCTSLPALLLRLVTQDVPPITDHISDLSPAVADAIGRALRRERKARFQSMAEFADALQERPRTAVADVGDGSEREPASAGSTAVDPAAATLSDHPSYKPVERPKGWDSRTVRRRYRFLAWGLTGCGVIGAVYLIPEGASKVPNGDLPKREPAVDTPVWPAADAALGDSSTSATTGTTAAQGPGQAPPAPGTPEEHARGLSPFAEGPSNAAQRVGREKPTPLAAPPKATPRAQQRTSRPATHGTERRGRAPFDRDAGGPKGAPAAAATTKRHSKNVPPPTAADAQTSPGLSTQEPPKAPELLTPGPVPADPGELPPSLIDEF